MSLQVPLPRSSSPLPRSSSPLVAPVLPTTPPSSDSSTEPFTILEASSTPGFPPQLPLFPRTQLRDPAISPRTPHRDPALHPRTPPRPGTLPPRIQSYVSEPGPAHMVQVPPRACQTLPSNSNECPVCTLQFTEEHDLAYRSFHVNHHLDSDLAS